MTVYIVEQDYTDNEFGLVFVKGTEIAGNGIEPDRVASLISRGILRDPNMEPLPHDVAASSKKSSKRKDSS